jgi:predicted flap endonuclease-1-like 5' DNA nuclease
LYVQKTNHNKPNTPKMSTTTIKYDAAKSQSTAATVADFARTDECELHDAPLTTIPGIGEVTAELFNDHQISTARKLVTKFRRFNRANRNHDEVAQRFFKWLREEIGGSFNKHTVTEAVENWVLEHVAAAADASSSTDEISYDPSKSGTSVSLVADFCRMSMRDLRNEDLTTVPGIGDASAELFEEAGIRTVKQLIRKYNSFARGRKNLAAEKFFQWQRANVGGTYNKHSVTNAVENYILETIHEEP